MAPNTDTRANLIAWFTMEFGFSNNAATALHDVQALKDAQALSELDDDDAVANVCKASLLTRLRPFWVRPVV